MLLRFWFLVLLVCVSAFAPSRADARITQQTVTAGAQTSVENATWRANTTPDKPK